MSSGYEKWRGMSRTTLASDAAFAECGWVAATHGTGGRTDLIEGLHEGFAAIPDALQLAA